MLSTILKSTNSITIKDAIPEKAEEHLEEIIGDFTRGGYRVQGKMIIGTHAFKTIDSEDKRFLQLNSNTRCFEMSDTNLKFSIKKLFEHGESLIEKLTNYRESGISIKNISSINIQFGMCIASRGGCLELDTNSGCEELTKLYYSRGVNNIEPETYNNRCFANSFYFVKEAFNVKNALKKEIKCDHCKEDTKRCKQCENILQHVFKF